jgi:hypothetical protein
MNPTHADLIEELAVAICPRVPSPTPEPVEPRRSDYALMTDALSALRVLTNPMLNDFSRYQHAQTETKLARAESNAASVTVELRLMRERCAELMSQSEPLAGLGVDRELVRQVLHYVQCGRLK